MSRPQARLVLGFIAVFALGAQDLKDFEKRVTEFTLANGMHFIVLERRQAPVVSFSTYVNAGSVDDPGGQTGIAHMFEHMAFKGTDSIGTKNWAEEKKALEAIERIYDQLEAERSLGFRANQAKLKDLEASLKAAIEKANSFVEPNVYPRIIEENGGVGLNAGTSMDSTVYFYNLPSNRAELWFLLESERFLKPVFREFYKERDVVREERRMRVESSPQGKLLEALLATAFIAHPYRNMPGGWASDIESFRATDAERFYKSHYAPVNITVGIAGDIAAAAARQLAQKYFGRIPAGPPPPRVRTVEPPQEGERRVGVETPAQPLLIIAYKRPDQLHKDDAAFDVVSSILSSGRTGLLYKEMVRDRKISLAAIAQPAFPQGKYPNLFLMFFVPAMGHTVEENEKAAYEIIERLKKEKVDQETLNRVKTKLRASLVRQLDSNSGLAQELASYHVNYGNWRKLFTGLEEINAVTAEDVQRVAREYFVERTRTVAYTVKPASEAKGEGK